ncbi:leucine-rich repeat domain-containing protein [Blautia sp. HCP28S3_G10]|uniref:leucine-rich repeat domain-containing protein n=1 Tax=Blautia sp. HCP28S3_G10 TaxID=3438908 RepID=UPI003F8BBD0C
MVMSFGGSVYAEDFADWEVASQAGESSSESNVYNGVWYSWGWNDDGGVLLKTAEPADPSSGYPAEVTIPAVRMIDGKEVPVTGLGDVLFSTAKRATIKKVTMPDTVTVIGSGAFEGCTNLESITLSKKLKEIQAKAFYGCTSLKSIVLPDSMQKIGMSAFEGCSSLSNVILGNGLSYIDVWAFNSCSSLKSITIPRNVTTIGGMHKIFSNSMHVTVYGYTGSAAEKKFASDSNVTFVALDKKSNSASGQNTGVSIKASDKTMTASASKKQTWTIGAKASNGAKLTYTSSNSKVKVSSAGKVTVPKKFAGKVKITIKTGKVSKTVTLTVKKAANPMKIVKKNQKVKASAVKKKAKTFRIKVTKAQGKVSYKSSNSKYVKVSGKGKVTVKKGCPKGTYKITVTAKGKGIYNKKSKTLTVRVK